MDRSITDGKGKKPFENVLQCQHVPGGDDECVGKEETLTDFASLADSAASSATGQTQTALTRPGFLLDDVQQTPFQKKNTIVGSQLWFSTTITWNTLADKDLSHVHEDVAALDNHPFDGQTLADVFRLAHLSMVRETTIEIQGGNQKR